MHTTILWTCTVVAVVVFGVMLYSVATFRGSNQDAGPAGMRRRSIVEFAWALIPIAICIGAALPAMRMVEATAVTMATNHE